QERGPADRCSDPVELARDHDARARLAHTARGARLAHALRHRHEHRPHSGRSRPAILGDARAHPPDRGQGVAQAQAPEPQPEAPQLPRQLTKTVIARLDRAIQYALRYRAWRWLLDARVRGHDINACATEPRNFPQPFAVSVQGEGVSSRTRRETDMRVLTVATLAALFVAGFAIPADAARPVKGAVQGTATAAKGVGHG